MPRLPALLLLLALPALATAQTFPKMKEGLWSTSTLSAEHKAKGEPARVATICLDNATQQLMIQFSQGMIKGMCSKNDMKVSGSTITADSVCDVMGSKIASKSTMKFAGDTAYHTESHSTYDPPLMGMKSGDTVIDGKYQGPCPAGMNPGDMKLPTGNTINLKSIAGNAGIK
jgi:hypothetical protein